MTTDSFRAAIETDGVRDIFLTAEGGRGRERELTPGTSGGGRRLGRRGTDLWLVTAYARGALSRGKIWAWGISVLGPSPRRWVSQSLQRLAVVGSAPDLPFLFSPGAQPTQVGFAVVAATCSRRACGAIMRPCLRSGVLFDPKVGSLPPRDAMICAVSQPRSTVQGAR